MGEVGPRGLCRLPVGRRIGPPVGRTGSLSLWWAGPCHGICLQAAVGSRTTLGSLSTDKWGRVPILLVVWPEASQDWSLQPVGCS